MFFTNPEELESRRRESEIKACQDGVEGCIRFINNWLWIQEPRKSFNDTGEPGWIPFRLWPAQERIIRELYAAYQLQEWRVMFKARGVGGTYVCEALMFWFWWGTPSFLGLVGSRKEEEVDYAKGKKQNTLFAKLDGFLDHLPDWMLPKGFIRREHRQHMLLTNPASKASISGESANANFGHSNRASMVLLDEYARWAYNVFYSVLGVSDFVVPISTLNANQDQFTDIVDDATKLERLILYTVKDNPKYTPKWLEEKERTTDPLVFAREYMMDRTASAAGRVYLSFNRKRHVGDYPYNPELPLVTFWDWGYSDETYMGFAQKDFVTNELFIIREVVARMQEIEWFVNFYPRAKVIPNPYFYPEELQEKQDDIQYFYRKPVMDFGDPSGKNRTQLRQGSLFKVLRQYGIKPRCNVARWQDMRDRVTSVRNLLSRLHVDESCEFFIKSMEAYSYPDRDEYSMSTAANETPAHNWASHAPTALESLAVSEDMWKLEEGTGDYVIHSVNPYTRKRTA